MVALAEEENLAQDTKKEYDASRRIMRAERFRVPAVGSEIPAPRDTHIAEILKNVFRNIETPEGALRDLLLKEWPALAGPFAAKHTKPGRLSNRVLVVFVKNSVWLRELSGRELKNIEKRVQKRFGSDKISKVVLKVGC